MAAKSKIEFMETYRQVRKPMPRPSRAINPKKRYNRRDKSWKNEF